MWSFASHAMAGSLGPRNNSLKLGQTNPDCSDDESSSCTSKEERLECPICWESFNIVENVPYVLWCGHTLCKNCVLGLKWAVVKFSSLPIQLPLFISCPWCQFLSFRLVYKGVLKFPRKNFFLLWMVESMNGERAKCCSSFCSDRQPGCPSNSALDMRSNGHHYHNHRGVSQPDSNHSSAMADYRNVERIRASLKKSLVLFVRLTAKFPLVIIFLLILLYAIPASAAILLLYILVTILFALPSFLILYFAYPSLDWLIKEIVT